MQRDRQLRIAQIQALQQREESMKQRVITHCDQNRLYLPPQLTASSSSTSSNHLAELISFILDQYLSSVGRGGGLMRSSSTAQQQHLDPRHLSNNMTMNMPTHSSQSESGFLSQSHHLHQYQSQNHHHPQQQQQNYQQPSLSQTQTQSLGQTDLLPTRHRSSSPVLTHPATTISTTTQQKQYNNNSNSATVAIAPRMPYEKDNTSSSHEELLRPISTRVSPLKSAGGSSGSGSRLYLTENFDANRSYVSGNRLDQSRNAMNQSVQQGMRSTTVDPYSSQSMFHQPQPQPQMQMQMQTSSGGDLQDRLRRTRMSFSSMKEM